MSVLGESTWLLRMMHSRRYGTTFRVQPLGELNQEFSEGYKFGYSQVAMLHHRNPKSSFSNGDSQYDRRTAIGFVDLSSHPGELTGYPLGQFVPKGKITIDRRLAHHHNPSSAYQSQAAPKYVASSPDTYLRENWERQRQQDEDMRIKMMRQNQDDRDREARYEADQQQQADDAAQKQRDNNDYWQQQQQQYNNNY
ncbi:hypothetical protein G7Y89_g401 [Cudoniella acicularis]|uniref:Uncharacterized protein n=1 Tax=Cudoniella acicularis TaxID=354080 RepID=A0A8H4RYV7_9HELO|nr:hypothetical protein G7Y89_g401 [Cudoniella acicularis]